MEYFDHKGNEITLAQIRAAVEAGTARLIHSRGDGRTLTALALKGAEIDTRGNNYSAWDDVWTTNPRSLAQAIHYGRSSQPTMLDCE